jgi:hypothetical protein
LYATTIVGLNSYFLFFIDKLTPDSLVTFFCFLAGIIAEKFRKDHPVMAGAGVASLLFVAFLTKETSMYLWPFFAFLIIVEWVQHAVAAYKFALSAIVVGLLLFTAYFLGYYLYTGDTFYRFNSIMDNHYTHPESYFDKPFSYLLVRLTYAPWQMFTESGLLVALLPGLLMALKIISHKRANLQCRENFWSWFAVVFLLCFYFGTTSLRYYNPLNLLPRMYFPLLPPFAILAGLFWAKAEHSAKTGIRLFLLFGSATIYCLFTGSKYTPVYAGYALIALCPFVVRSAYTLLILRSFFLIVSLTIPLYRIMIPQQWGYQAEKKIFQIYLSQQSGNYLVVTDNRLMLTYNWFYHFQPPPNYTFTEFASASSFSPANYTKTYVLFNPHTFRESFGNFDEWNSWEQLYRHQLKELAILDDVVLYEWSPGID